MNKTVKIMLCAVMLIAFTLMVLFGGEYLDASRKYKVLKNDLADSTAIWKHVNESKLVIQKELKAVRSDLREVELTISESEERAAELEAEISQLEKDVETLKSAGSPVL